MPVAKKCKLCTNIDLYYDTFESFNIHLRDNHQDRVPADYEGDAWRCNVCHKYFDTEAEFANHIGSAHR
jgi:hypothetical protein